MWSEDRIRGAENESSPIKDYSLHAPGRSGSWCTAVTLTHKAAQNGHVCEMRDKKRVLLLSALHSFTHTHTHTGCVCTVFLPICLSSYSLAAFFFPSSFSLFLPLSFSIRFCLVFFVYILFPYFTISLYHFYLHFLYSDSKRPHKRRAQLDIYLPSHNANPGDWKKAIVFPIYKGGDRSVVGNN